MQTVRGRQVFPCGDNVLPAYRTDLSHPLIVRNVETPYNRPSLLRQAKPQSTLLVVREQEAGKSECRPVMGTRVEEQSDITRPEKSLTSYAGAPLQEKQENLLQGGSK